MVLETYLANAQVIFFDKEGINQKKQNMWTTSYNGINSGYQNFINFKSHLGSAASFVQKQRLSYKLVGR